MASLGMGTDTGDQKCNRAEKKFDNNFHLHDRRMDRHKDNGHGTTAKTALTRSVSQLKLHQIVLMCCCTASIIHTYLLTAVPS